MSTPVTSASPKGVIYKWTKDQTEFQLFPESYFSGADVKIYFGDVFIDDVLGISFTLQEQVKPIFSYASRTYKEVARGNRIVSGKFYIAFREAGYISAVFDHIGQLGVVNAQNDLVSTMQGQTPQEWHAGILETWEHLINNTVGEGTAETQKRLSSYEAEIWGRDQSSDINHENSTFFFTSRTNAAYQTERLKKEGFDIFITYGPLESAIAQDRTLKTVSFDTTVKAIRQVQLLSSSQEIVGDGTIIEVYDFLAKDCD